MAKKVEPVDKVVGQNIRIFRSAKGISQSELGKAIGVTFQQVQKYESGANRVGSSRLAKIAKALNTPISSLFDNSATSLEGRVSGSMVTDLLITPDAVRMLRAFAKLPNDHLRRSILALTETLAKNQG
ncbi:MAG TPA: helix-turn-helix transcriptional regulator [Xanthobacteraceae bacterium]|nr:helix-turn-helix transcriptional regulator [Xanthobacteraceae bacterium]